jgi:hypothetical protein
VTGCRFEGNSAGAWGGGGLYDESYILTMDDCTFSGNSTDTDGGGMLSVFPEESTVSNCVFVGNTADQRGGGMFSYLAIDSTLANCTFSGNSAAEGAGMFNVDVISATVANCILWADTPDEIAGEPPSVSFSDVHGGFAGPGNIGADPLFLNPDNGDLHLSPGSPCIDAADNTAVPQGITTDLEGNPRFVDDPGTEDTGYGDPPIVDMGAYEFQGMPCPWDLNGNGYVWIIDFLLFLWSWGSCDDPGHCPADFDGDSHVGVMDLLDLLCHFGPCP